MGKKKLKAAFFDQSQTINSDRFKQKLSN